MECPVCNNTQLVMTERKSIEIDYCPNCRGVWLDRGKLDKLIEKSVENSPATSFSDEREHGNHGYSKSKHYRKKGSYLVFLISLIKQPTVVDTRYNNTPKARRIIISFFVN